MGVQILVAEGDSGVLGYIVGRAVRDQGEILNLGVPLNARRRGVGTSLVRQLLASFAAAGVREVFLEVRESNRTAQALYESFGFVSVGRRVGYYRQPRESAILMVKEL